MGFTTIYGRVFLDRSGWGLGRRLGPRSSYLETDLFKASCPLPTIEKVYFLAGWAGSSLLFIIRSVSLPKATSLRSFFWDYGV